MTSRFSRIPAPKMRGAVKESDATAHPWRLLREFAYRIDPRLGRYGK